METNALIQKLKAAVSGAVLKTAPLGKKGDTTVWVEARTLPEVARFLRELSGVELDWLENFSVIEIEEALVLTYFARSTLDPYRTGLIIRSTLMPSTPDAEVSAPSLISIWPMAAPFESEASELWGIRFEGGLEPGNRILPQGWHGYPLRKSYHFPNEVEGILHMRPLGRTAPDEFEVHS